MKVFLRFLMVFAGVLAVMAVSCTKKGSSEDPAVVAGELWLRGTVVNAVTNLAVAGATVVVEGQAMLTTDASGNYAMNVKNLVPGTYMVRATAAGFGYGSTDVQVSANAAVANTIRLTPLSAPVTINPQGGTVTVPDPEALMPGARAVLTVPAGAFAQPVSLSLTRFTGNGVPGYAPDNYLNLGTFHLSPAGVTAGKAMQIELPLPLNTLAAGTIPLLKYDAASDSWQLTGTLAQVNPGANVAVADILSTGTYSLAIPGNYSETDGAQGAQTTIQVDPKQSSVVMSYLALNNFPGQAPATVTGTYLSNLAAQNTSLHGKKISFSDSTYTTVNYIGHKPDSVPAARSTSGGYYRWVPQVGYHQEEIPAVIVLDGITISGTVNKELQYDLGIWQFVHDQGGGGK